jgi:crotonobetainyl-CoA:carnitine CoA-transferase CaiB-like acyl-CoA transferase
MDRSRLDSILLAGRIALPDGADIEITGADPVLAARFAIGEVAAAALAIGGAQAAALWRLHYGEQQRVRVDVRAAAASLLSFLYLRVAANATARTNEGNAAVALYRCADGRWIHLHGGFPGLLAGTLDVLGCENTAESLAAAVATWRSDALEDALAARGMCGAVARTAAEWAAHPQGQALADAAAIELTKIGDAPAEALPPGARSLSGVRVLDLTRVLAGPACGRTLAQYGADVLHIASPSLPTIPVFDIDTGHGKRSAHLDLDSAAGPATLRTLVRDADVFVDGFRSGSMERRGFSARDVAALRPGIVYVSINCYGHTGPWRERPGWEQLAQTVTGIAAAQAAPGEPPRLVPAAACDYTTGYLAAYGVMLALERRAREGGSWLVEASLCQTAMWIERLGATCDPASASGAGDVSDLLIETATPFGPVTHLRPAVDLSATPARWDRPTVPLGTDAAAWGDR